MYNKLFSKILVSSLWLQDDQTVRLWVTLLAAMDEDGFAPFASIANLAHHARLTLADTERVIAYLEGPDPHSGNPDNDGRRVERVSGGWLVLNARSYREIVTRAEALRRNRERVTKYRSLRKGPHDVTDGALQTCECNAIGITPPLQTAICNGSVMESDQSRSEKRSRSSRGDDRAVEGFPEFWQAYPRKVAKAAALKAWGKLRPDAALQAAILRGLQAATRSEQWQRDAGAYVPHAATWLNGRRWEDELTGAQATAAGDAVTAERQRAAQLLAEMQAKLAAAKRRREGGEA
jgi:hypothetical protein